MPVRGETCTEPLESVTQCEHLSMNEMQADLWNLDERHPIMKKFSPGGKFSLFEFVNGFILCGLGK
jgi:hypothetical protein